MSPNLTKFLLYAGIIEIIAGAIVFLLVSKLVGIIIILVGISDVAIVYFLPAIKGEGRPEGDESPPPEE